ncbi:hypothetical protein RIF29_04512 [Crotalaria pallida]|uniref:Leucine-rich repeat-containing N-terminal plant-type domain-containing protein n=1 Tax=Crotalaria pallida TaxID=3830 RepID=A0AAN9J217_CROPI
MLPFSSHMSILLLMFLYGTPFQICISSNHTVVHCNEKDQGALFIFKQGVVDAHNRLSTWSSELDCCAWEGVQCDLATGRVTRLDLYREYLKGEINLSLFQLQFLNYLDLSWNNFTAISVPPIPDNITTTTSLHLLDLSFNYHLDIDNLRWLSQLSSLKYLDLTFVHIQNQSNWLHTMAMLPSLSELILADCELNNIYPSLKYVNFTSLVTLDLAVNNFNSGLPNWLFNLNSSISYIDLSSNQLKGSIPNWPGQLENLQHIDLSSNQLQGSIPNWLGQLEHLQHVDLSNNFFSGSIPSSLGNLSSLIESNIRSNLLTGNLPDTIGQLFKLNVLRVGNNSLSGKLSEMIFSNLSNLKSLDLNDLALEFDINTNWIPSFQLSEVGLRNTIQGPNFPAWLYAQRSLRYLDISSAGISSIDGDRFPSFVAGITYHLSLFNNSISADISNITLNSTFVYLNHNSFTGRLPHITTNVQVLDVSHNSFSGGFPNSLMNSNVIYINMASNNLAGQLALDMSNMTSLIFMNLGKNELYGKIPTRMPPGLEMLILRSNQFMGNIAPQLCDLSLLHILDLAHNKLSGSIPRCLHNLTNMVSDYYLFYFQMTFNLVIKGQELEFSYNGCSRTIDLSVNDLSGEIPAELIRLVKVRSLNLSHNNLIGTIPKMIGDMTNLESLDLSYNQLTGEIPQSMSGLTFLEVLNVSYNNFNGHIPSGSQLQTFDAWSYVGNHKLCGPPVTKTCSQKENPNATKQHAGGDPFRESLYLGMGVGFAVSFWGVCGSLFLNKTWRHAYFRFLNHVVDKIYVIVAIKLRSFH